jgi:polyisoprenoid-binding protein YceI
VRRLLKIVILSLALVVIGAVAGWYFFLKGDPAPRATITETPTVATTSQGADGAYTVSAESIAAAATEGSRSFVGYRVTEKLVANLVETDATGRTSTVKGTLRVQGTTVDSVTITADLRTLASDSGLRDGRIRDSGLESNRFPEAKFVLTQPITLAGTPTTGQTVTVNAVGTFTLHGVTHDVTIPIQARWDGRLVQVVGNLPIKFSDYNITAPTAPLVASVHDEGEMEFQLFFAHG